MGRNLELLEKTMQYIEDHPEQHNQQNWWCGTSGCFAGWALSLSGLPSEEILRLKFDIQSNDLYPRLRDEAIRVLGLSDIEAIKLFGCRNSRPMLALMVKDLVNGDELRSIDDYESEASC